MIKRENLNFKMSAKQNIFFLPSFVIWYYFKRIKQDGLKHVSYKLKKLDEARIVSLFLIAIWPFCKFPQWLQVIEDREQTPDISIFSPKKIGKGFSRGLKPVEVFKITHWNKSDFISELKKKIHETGYLKASTVLCYINRPQDFGPLPSLNQKVASLKPRVSDIWVLAVATPISDPNLGNNFTAIQLWPKEDIFKGKRSIIIKDFIAAFEEIKRDYPGIIQLIPGLDTELNFEKIGQLSPKLVEELLTKGVPSQV